MNSMEVQEFLLTATSVSESILVETDNLFEKTSSQDPNNTTQSMYFSINDDTLSNRLVDDLQKMERTLTEVTSVEEEEITVDSSKSTEMSSVIQNTNVNPMHMDLMMTTKDEEFFQQSLNPLKMFTNRSQCSTPKLDVLGPKQEATTPVKPVTMEKDVKLDPSLAIPQLVLPLTTVLQKIEKKVTIMVEEEKPTVENVEEATGGDLVENKENVEEHPSQPKQAKLNDQPNINNKRKSLKPPELRSAMAPKRTLRKSIAPTSTVTSSTGSSSAGSEKGAIPKPSLLNARRSVRMSVVPPTMRSTRFTIGGRTGKIHSPSSTGLSSKSPKTKRLNTLTRPSMAAGSSSATTTSTSASTSSTKNRLTIAGGVTKPTTTTKTSSALSSIKEDEKKINPTDTSAATSKNSRMSRIPGFPSKPAAEVPVVASIATQPRPVFACGVCKKTFHLKSTLDTHQKMHETKKGNVSSATANSRQFKCSFCDKNFEKEIGLRNHMEKYCEKVSVAEKRKLNASHNRTRTTSAEVKDRSRKADKSTSSVGSSSSISSSHNEPSTTSIHSSVSANMIKLGDCLPPAPSQHQLKPLPPPASGLSPRKPIKSICQPHSGIKFSANKPIKCFHCQITFVKYVDFHVHVEQMHPPEKDEGEGNEKQEEGEKKELESL